MRSKQFGAAHLVGVVLILLIGGALIFVSGVTRRLWAVEDQNEALKQQISEIDLRLIRIETKAGL